MNNGSRFSGVTISGPAAAVNAARSVLQNSAATPGTPAANPNIGAPSSAAPSCGCGTGGGGGGSGTGYGGAGPGSSVCGIGCLAGSPGDCCPPGVFMAYLAQNPLYVQYLPTRNYFDVPYLVAASFFSDVATLTQSQASIVASLVIGGTSCCCEGTQVTAVTAGSPTSSTFTITAPTGETLFIPGILFTIGFSNNTSPGPVTITVTGTGTDGGPFSVGPVRVTLSALGQGQLAMLFNTVVQQRLYPVIAQVQSDVPLIPAGATLNLSTGAATLTTAFNEPNQDLLITVTGPTGTSVTAETITWNHPSLACLWNQALGTPNPITAAPTAPTINIS